MPAKFRGIEAFRTAAINKTKKLAENYAQLFAEHILEVARRELAQSSDFDIPIISFDQALQSGEITGSGNKRKVKFGGDAGRIEFGDPGFTPLFGPIFKWARDEGFKDPKKKAWSIINMVRKEGIEAHPFFTIAIEDAIRNRSKLFKKAKALS